MDASHLAYITKLANFFKNVQESLNFESKIKLNFTQTYYFILLYKITLQYGLSRPKQHLGSKGEPLLLEPQNECIHLIDLMS